MVHARRVGPTVGQSLLKYWWIVIISAILFASLGFLWSSQQDNQYTATTRLFLSHSSAFDGVGQSSYVANPDRYAINQATLATSRPVLARAVDDSDLDVDVEDLTRSLVVTAGRGNDVIIIEATAATPELAAQHANAVSEAYQALKLDEVERQTEQLTSLSTSPGERAAVLKRAAVYGDGIELVERAAPPEFPSSPQPLRDALLALLVGTAVGAALAAGYDRFKRSRPSQSESQSSNAQPLRREPLADEGAAGRGAYRRQTTPAPVSEQPAPSSADEPGMAKSSTM